MRTPSDPYAELGVSPDATPAEVTHAFRRLLRRHHPDTRADDGCASRTESDAALLRIIEAYAGLVQARTPMDSHTEQPRRSSQVQSGSQRHVWPAGEVIRAGPIRWSAR